MRCRYCGLEPEKDRCVHCGAPQPEETEQPMKMRQIIFLAMAASAFRGFRLP